MRRALDTPKVRSRKRVDDDFEMGDGGAPLPSHRVGTWTMLNFYAEQFVAIAANVIELCNTAEAHKDESVSAGDREVLLEKLADFKKGCIPIGLELTVKGIERIQGILSENQKLNHDALAELFKETIRRMHDELSLNVVLLVPKSRVEFYRGRNLFGESVSKNFPSAILDIEEAAKCYALGRNTGCVFHLMRVMEVGLRALGASLNDERLDPRRNPSWDAILKKCDEEMSQRHLSERSKEWRENDQFFSGATATLRSVKDAWRNPTMHVEQTYDEETALDVWNAVRGFMRHLATKLMDNEASEAALLSNLRIEQ